MRIRQHYYVCEVLDLTVLLWQIVSELSKTFILKIKFGL